MSNIIAACEAHVENLRAEWLRNNDIAELEPGLNTISRRNVVIADKEHLETVHSEINEHRSLVVFEVSRKQLIGSVHHCLGAELDKNGKVKLVTEKALWADGIP